MPHSWLVANGVKAGWVGRLDLIQLAITDAVADVQDYAADNAAAALMQEMVLSAGSRLSSSCCVMSASFVLLANVEVSLCTTSL